MSFREKDKEEAVETVMEDFVVTGSMDNAIKSWKCKGDTLLKKYECSGHSFGIVSLDTNSDSSSAWALFFKNSLCILS